MKQVFIIILIIASCAVQAQSLKKDKTDLYTQHFVVNNGDIFQFTFHNTKARSKYASFDKKVKEKGSFQSLKVSFEEMKSKSQMFWLRHPIMIKPYTEYVFRYKSLVNNTPQNMPELELAVYDQTRETQVESHTFRIEAGKGWQQGEVRFKTANQARFARLKIIANPSENPGEVYFNAMELQQISEAEAFIPDQIQIFSIQNYSLSGDYILNKDKIKLPARDYYAISAAIRWNDPKDECLLIFEWLDSSLNKIGQEVCNFSPMKGVLPSWNGVEINWEKMDDTGMDWISREKERFYNEDGKEGTIKYKTYKPKQAKYIRVIKKGSFEGILDNLLITGEY